MEGGENKDDEKDTRFIIDVTEQIWQSAAGWFGHLREKQFDLFVRSGILSKNDEGNDIVNIFSEFIEISGVKGTLLFQSQTHFCGRTQAFGAGA